MANVYIFIAALAIGGWAVVYLASQRHLKRTCADLRLEFQRQIDSLSAKIAALERTGVEASAPLTAAVAAAAAGGPLLAEPVTDEPPQAAPTGEEVAPEVLQKLTQTATALLGRKVRICSAKVLQTPDPTVNLWGRQGRVVIQASHDIAQRRPE